MSAVAAGRRWARDELRRLDPVVDNERITHLSGEVRYGDPALTAMLYTVAFSRQMAVPSIAAVIHRGGQGPVMGDTRRRTDDTLTFFGDFMRLGHSTKPGRACIERLNAIHSRFPITNDESLYTLASLALEADRIPRLLGVSLLTEQEKLANFHFWRGVGVQMGLHDIPATYDAFMRWTLRYEAEHYAYSSGGRAVVDAMLDDYAVRVLPAPLRRTGRALVLAAMDARLLDTHRLKHPKAATRWLLANGLRAYVTTRKLLPDPPDRSWADYYGAEKRG